CLIARSAYRPAPARHPSSCLPSISYSAIHLLPVYPAPAHHPAPARHIAPTRSLAPARPSSPHPSPSSRPQSSSCPLSLFLGFSFSSRLIMLVEIASVWEVISSEVGSSGKLSLSEKVVLVLLAVEAGASKEGSGFLPSKRVLGCTIKGGIIKADAG